MGDRDEQDAGAFVGRMARRWQRRHSHRLVSATRDLGLTLQARADLVAEVFRYRVGPEAIRVSDLRAQEETYGGEED